MAYNRELSQFSSFVIVDDSSKNISIASSETQNVGIGTTNPISKLSIIGGDISVGVDTSHGVILSSPNGTQYRLIVDNSGNLSTTSV